VSGCNPYYMSINMLGWLSWDCSALQSLKKPCHQIFSTTTSLSFAFCILMWINAFYTNQYSSFSGICSDEGLKNALLMSLEVIPFFNIPT
jgi:hypothetical protein